MKKIIPLSVPNLNGNEKKYVLKAIEDEWVSTAGPFVEEFEEKISKYVKVKGAVACQNGTSGIHISLLVNGIERGDEVLAPTLTFIAAINPIRYIGAEPVFIDCDDSLSIDPKKILEFIENECEYVNGKIINKNSKKQIKAILVVHIFGNMADMENIMSVAEKYNLKVIEDATEALGTYYLDGKYSGKYAGTIGDIGVYSFNGNKIITTGGGGMIVSNNKELLKKAKYLTTQAKDDLLYYTHNEIGYNYRMTNIQAAMGVAQLEQLENFIKIKEENYNIYKNEIDKIKGVEILKFRDNVRANYWFYSLKLDNETLRDKLLKYLKENKIQSRPIWSLIHTQKPYIYNQNYKIKLSKKYLNTILNIPCSSNLSKEDARYVIKILKEFMKFN